mmetsp:Transcript_3292/g.10260  ORF Transcript_3292/g.10260 Transcript_3292/m.10260 type:complete len:237 (+) Transcript_3292:142-852(+)
MQTPRSLVEGSLQLPEAPTIETSSTISSQQRVSLVGAAVGDTVGEAVGASVGHVSGTQHATALRPARCSHLYSPVAESSATCSRSRHSPVCRFQRSRVHTGVSEKSQPVSVSADGSSAAEHSAALTLAHMEAALSQVVPKTHSLANQPPLVAPHTSGTPPLPFALQQAEGLSVVHSPCQRRRLGQQPISGGSSASSAVVGALVGEAVGGACGPSRVTRDISGGPSTASCPVGLACT